MWHNGNRIKLLIVEDEDLFRELLHSKLADYPQIAVVGEASTGPEAIQQAELLSPDVVLMDIDLGGKVNGIAAGQIIRSSAPSTASFSFRSTATSSSSPHRWKSAPWAGHTC